jgi:hypothetical protein
MARKASQPTPQLAHLSAEAKRNAIPRFQRRIEELKSFEVKSTQQWGAPEVTKLSHAIDRTLTDTFGPDTVEYNRYSYIKDLGRVRSMSLYDAPQLHEYHQYLQEDISEAIAVMEGIISGFQEDIDHAPAPSLETQALTHAAPKQPNDKVFVVHGHDEAMREAVARFLQALGLQPKRRNDRRERQSRSGPDGAKDAAGNPQKPSGEGYRDHESAEKGSGGDRPSGPDTRDTRERGRGIDEEHNMKQDPHTRR